MASNTDPRIFSIYAAHRPIQIQNTESELTIPLHLVLRNLALRPTSGDPLFPSSWTSLEIAETISVDLSESVSN